MTTPLHNSVGALQSSLHLLTSSISILDASVSDFPRLGKVLQTTRHFELLPEPTLHAAQTALLSEIAPQVDFLLARVATHLDRLERREKALMARAELLEGRMEGRVVENDERTARERGRDEDRDGGEGRTGGKGGEKGRREGAELEELRVRAMRQKKERLSYAVERLTLQAQQRERQLRMSVARGEEG